MYFDHYERIALIIIGTLCIFFLFFLPACSGESPLTVEPPVEQQISTCPGPVAYIENCLKCHGDD